jgi:hypothetical protein
MRGDERMAGGQLVVWSAARGEWLTCPPDEITWLDRKLLSDGKDTTLHRPPRCPGLRLVHYRWELFSRDTTHWVYVAPYAGVLLDHRSVQGAARHVLPIAPDRYETVPVRLEEGAWLVSVGRWVLPVCIDVPAQRRGEPTVPHRASEPHTQQKRVRLDGGAGQPSPALPGAAAKVRAFFKRNDTARLAMAYYYQQFILGAVAPQEVPMIDVAIALDLRGEGAVSDYKKELQRRIWNEQRHQRELADFLLSGGLLGQADLERALQAAAANERSGRSDAARKRLRYRPKR